MSRMMTIRIVALVVSMSLAVGITLAQQKGGQGDENASGGFDAEGFHASIENATAADFDKIGKLTGMEFGNLQMFQIMMEPARLFIRKDGQFNKDASKEAFKAAIDNITPEKIERATGLMVGKSEYPKLYEFCCLLAASGAFVYERGKVNADAFNSALNNITVAKIQKTKDLVNYKEGGSESEQGSSEPLYLLLRASGHFVNKEGKFDNQAFNSAFDAITSDKMNVMMKQGSKPDDAFGTLMRLRAGQSFAARQPFSRVALIAILSACLLVAALFLLYRFRRSPKKVTPPQRQ